MRVGICYRRIKVKWVFILSAIVLCFCLITGFFVVRASPIFKLRAAETALQAVKQTIAEVAGDTMADFNGNFIEKTLTSNGEIAMISINSAQMNKLRAEFESELIKRLAKGSRASISISAGSLLGKEVFQGAGISIPVKITYGSVSEIDIEDEFISAGINQTKHRINMRVTVSTSVISAFMFDCRTVETTVPLCENIIVGKVPQYYTDRLAVTAKGE